MVLFGMLDSNAEDGQEFDECDKALEAMLEPHPCDTARPQHGVPRRRVGEKVRLAGRVFDGVVDVACDFDPPLGHEALLRVPRPAQRLLVREDR